MPILSFTQDTPYTEAEMQEQVIKLIGEDRKIKRGNPSPSILSEITIPNLGRRSDIIIYFSKRKIVNIECKLTNVSSVLAQARDHLKWANYSSICMPATTYIPTYQQKQMIEEGIGLLMYTKKHELVELIYPKYISHSKSNILRQDAISRIEKNLKK